jgi:hypothetical protein
MNDKPKPNRPWFQFSLRTMFVLVTLACIVLAWVGYSLHWIRQRDDILRQQPIMLNIDPFPRIPAPAGLWLFGEEGVAQVYWRRGSSPPTDEVQRLFPEAEVTEVEASNLDHSFDGPPP